MIVVIEGGDQAGKMTQSAMLTQALTDRGKKVRQFDFPDYTTPIGAEIKRFLERKQEYAPQVIHCLLAANRWEKARDIQDAQKNNDILIMNRYYHSNIVYGITNGVDKAWLENLDAGLPEADSIILLDITAEESFRRKSLGRDRFEGDKEFIAHVLDAYLNAAKKGGWNVVDASKSKDDIHEEILQIIERAGT